MSIRVLFALCLVGSATINAKDVAATINTSLYKGKSAGEVVGAIQTGIVFSFMKNLIFEGLEKKDSDALYQTFAEYDESVRTDIQKKRAPAEYEKVMNELTNMSTLLVSTIKLLQDNYGKFYTALHDPRLDQKYVLNKTVQLTDAEKNKLKSVKKQIEKLQTHAFEISNKALATINQNTPEDSPEWTKGFKIRGGLVTIFPTHKQFLQEYETRVTDETQLESFLAAQGYTTLKQIETLLNNLDYVTYAKVSKKITRQAASAIEALKKKYPSIISLRDEKKVASTTDRASATLFAQALALEGIGKNIIKNINELIAKD